MEYFTKINYCQDFLTGENGKLALLADKTALRADMLVVGGTGEFLGLGHWYFAVISG